jgi:hypothetical protein
MIQHSPTGIFHRGKQPSLVLDRCQRARGKTPDSELFELEREDEDDEDQ